MTHLLFEKKNNSYNRYVLSALYYFKPEDIENRKIIMDALNKYYNDRIQQKLKIGFDNTNEDIVSWSEKLRKLSLPDFLTTPKYIRVGNLDIETFNNNEFTIHGIDAWMMKPGSGLQMICSLLRIFLNDFNTLFLTPETSVVRDYWIKLGFKNNNINNRESMVNTDITSILTKCASLPPNVKLILKFAFDSNEHYTDNLEKVKELVKTIETRENFTRL